MSEQSSAKTDQSTCATFGASITIWCGVMKGLIAQGGPKIILEATDAVRMAANWSSQLQQTASFPRARPTTQRLAGLTSSVQRRSRLNKPPTADVGVQVNDLVGPVMRDRENRT